MAAGPGGEGGVGDSGAAMEVTRKYDGRRYGGVTEGDMEV